MARRYFVLGTGVGKAIAAGLLALEKGAEPVPYPSDNGNATPDDSKSVLVALGDINYRKKDDVTVTVCDVVEDLRKKFNPSAHVEAVEFDAESEGIALLFRHFDVVISALPARYNPRLAKIAVESGAHFIDLGGVLEITRKIQTLDGLARKTDRTISSDNGLAPGLVASAARLLMDFQDYTHTIEFYAGGLPQVPLPPVYYQRVFSLEGLKHICYDNVPILRNGKIRWKRPFSGYELRHFEELKGFETQFGDEVEAFYTAGCGFAPWTFQKWGVRNLWEKTIRWPGFIEFIRSKKIPAEDFEKEIAPYVSIPVERDHPDFVFLKVIARGERNGREVTHSFTLLDKFDEETGLTAMQRGTGFPTAAAAKLAAEGKTITGFHPPEEACDQKEFFEMLKNFFTFTIKEEN